MEVDNISVVNGIEVTNTEDKIDDWLSRLDIVSRASEILSELVKEAKVWEPELSIVE